MIHSSALVVTQQDFDANVTAYLQAFETPQGSLKALKALNSQADTCPNNTPGIDVLHTSFYGSLISLGSLLSTWIAEQRRYLNH